MRSLHLCIASYPTFERNVSHLHVHASRNSASHHHQLPHTQLRSCNEKKLATFHAEWRKCTLSTHRQVECTTKAYATAVCRPSGHAQRCLRPTSTTPSSEPSGPSRRQLGHLGSGRGRTALPMAVQVSCGWPDVETPLLLAMILGRERARALAHDSRSRAHSPNVGAPRNHKVGMPT